MKKYAFFGGSFNPINIAHIELANKVIKQYSLDRLFFVPVGNTYKKDNLADEEHRYNLLKLVCSKYQNIDVSDLELHTDKGFKAIEIFRIINNLYKNSENYFIMGADNFRNILNWNSAKELIENYKFIILPRDTINLEKFICNEKLLFKNKKNINILQLSENINCSSSKVRKLINQGKSVENLLEREVITYIEENKLYNAKILQNR